MVVGEKRQAGTTKVEQLSRLFHPFQIELRKYTVEEVKYGRWLFGFLFFQNDRVF